MSTSLKPQRKCTSTGEAMIQAVSAKAPTIVLLQIPGAAAAPDILGLVDAPSLGWLTRPGEECVALRRRDSFSFLCCVSAAQAGNFPVLETSCRLASKLQPAQTSELPFTDSSQQAVCLGRECRGSGNSASTYSVCRPCLPLHGQFRFLRGPLGSACGVAKDLSEV